MEGWERERKDRKRERGGKDGNRERGIEGGGWSEGGRVGEILKH